MIYYEMFYSLKFSKYGKYCIDSNVQGNYSLGWFLVDLTIFDEVALIFVIDGWNPESICLIVERSSHYAS